MKKEAVLVALVSTMLDDNLEVPATVIEATNYFNSTYVLRAVMPYHDPGTAYQFCTAR